MRIDQLDLKAFGPFTAETLDLSRGQYGLHVIHGPNEAGKSSALRALKQMLFGIKHQTTDNFLHTDNKALRIGATLRHEDGSTLAFIRRKAIKKSLFLGPEDEEEVEEAVLSGKFLGGIAADHFERMFTLDHASLSDGGKATLDAGGQFAEVLFGAGLNLPNLRAYQKTLEKQMDDLFRPRGTNQTINHVLAKLGAAHEAIQAASIKGSDWTEKTTRLSDLKRDKEGVDREWSQLDRERKRLDRIHKALPDLARRAWLRDELTHLDHALLLPEDFSERHREVLNDARSAVRSQIEMREELDRISSDLAALPPRSEILVEAHAIEALHTDLGGEIKAARDRIKLRRKLADHLVEARAHLQELGRDEDPETAASPHLAGSGKVQIRNLANDGASYLRDLLAARQEITQADLMSQEAMARIQAMPEPRSSETLRRTLTRIDGGGDPTESLASAERDRVRLRREIKSLLARLDGLVTDDPEAVAAMPIPEADVIESFKTRLAQCEMEWERERAESARLEDDLLELDARIERRRREADVPSEDDLREARLRREVGWRRIKASWREGRKDQEAEGAEGSLAEAFEALNRRADDVADRLRHDAARVAEKVHDLADRDKQAAKLALARTRRDEARNRLDEMQRLWTEAWASSKIVPRSPQEMSSWAMTHAKVVEKVQSLAEKTDQIAAWEESLARSVAEIQHELSALGEPEASGESLGQVRARAEAVVDAIRDEVTRRRDWEKSRVEAQTRLASAELRRAEAERSRETWSVAWAKAMKPLGLGADASDEQAFQTFEAITKFVQARDAAAKIAAEIREGDAETDRFHRRIRDMAERLAPDLVEEDPRAVVEELVRLLQDARAGETRRDEVEKQRREKVASLGQADAKIAGANLALADLCREAGCSRPEELPEIERRSDQRRVFETELTAVEGRLIPLAAGASLDDFAGEAAPFGADELPGTLQTLEDAFLKVDSDRQVLSGRIGGVETELRGLQETARDAKAEAAAVEREDLMSKLETHVDRYVHLRLASSILRGAIEEFRQQNQAPVLMRAGELFASLTLGSFRELRVDTNEKNQPVLVGVRPDGKTSVGVEQMSIGSVDQLYLALKLALLDHYLQTHPALPLVLDDLLIQFDDARASAALRALAELSKRTQVLFFTHHDHLVELARSCVSPDTLFVQHLGTPRPSTS